MDLCRSVDLVVVIISLSHGEATAALLYDAGTDHVLECVAATPLTAIASAVAFHLVTLLKVIPRTQKLDRIDRRVCSTWRSFPAWGCKTF